MTGPAVDGLAEAAAQLVTAAALLVAAALWVSTRSWQPTVPVLLELLLAAGLLRLGAGDSWQAIGAAAAIVVIRVVVGADARRIAGVAGGRRRPRRTHPG